MQKFLYSEAIKQTASDVKSKFMFPFLGHKQQRVWNYNKIWSSKIATILTDLFLQ